MAGPFKAPTRLALLIHFRSFRGAATSSATNLHFSYSYPTAAPCPRSAPFVHLSRFRPSFWCWPSSSLCTCSPQSRGFSSGTSASSCGAGPSSSHSFMEFIKAAAARGPTSGTRIAIRADSKSYTYSDVVSSAWKVSDLLFSSNLKATPQKNGSLEPSPCEEDRRMRSLYGARIGIVAKPSAEFVAGMLGIWLSGGVAVPLALSYPETELLYVMSDSEISMILSTEEHQELMKTVATKSCAKFSLMPSVTSSSVISDQHDAADVAHFDFNSSLSNKKQDEGIIKGDDPALIIYTSGTTGKPKGVVHTQGTITSQVQILSEAWKYSSSDQFLHCLPLHHVHGLFNSLLAPLYAGSMVEFMPKFSVRGIWQRWQESYPEDGSQVDNAITVFTGVPTMYTRLLQGYEAMDSNTQRISSSAAHKLRLMMCGSSALPFPIMKQWESITGHRLLERYGMTEFVMALSNPLEGDRKGGTVGKPLPRVQAKILAEDGSVSEPHEGGELCIKSPSLFKEYWKRPEATKESFTDDGFFKTGDSVRVDEEGYYIILGRTNADIMKVGGYKISALEIESVILEHQVVSECAVLGLPDKYYGEVVCAIVVLAANAETGAKQELQHALSLEDLQSWLKEKLAPYKIPTKLFVWSALPRNAMGKVNKKELKQLLNDTN